MQSNNTLRAESFEAHLEDTASPKPQFVISALALPGNISTSYHLVPEVKAPLSSIRSQMILDNFPKVSRKKLITFSPTTMFQLQMFKSVTPSLQLASVLVIHVRQTPLTTCLVVYDYLTLVSDLEGLPSVSAAAPPLQQ